MVVGIVFALGFGALLWLMLNRLQSLTDPRFTRGVMGGFVLRMCVQLVIRDVKLFSHVAGGDSVFYEIYARVIAFTWERHGIHFVTSDEILEVGPTSLPPNLFAVIGYIGGPESLRLGCTGLVALGAGLTALNLFLLCRDFGASKQQAFFFSMLMYYMPSFLFYTSDMYKDGLVVAFTLGSLGSALRLSRRFSVLTLATGLVCVSALWYVRFYLIFVTVAPLVVGIVGVNSKGLFRSLVAAVLLTVGAMVLVASSDVLQAASARATETFEHGTSIDVITANAGGGSGVVFDDGGSPFGALPAKLAYTIFAPFPWAGGSLGFQIGKLDVFLWYFVVYRAVRAALTIDRKFVIMLGTFLVPSTVMYAMSMSNVGLIVRQRLVIVFATTILASLYRPVVAMQRPVRDANVSRALRMKRLRSST